MPIVDERHEINKVINELEKEGVSLDNIDEMTGLGDVVEGVLIKFGVTEERFKKWFNLRECNCSKRKQWLNKIFSWRKRKKGEA
jgi:hypothetical protein|tara:strand:- start:1124 stop:1375 length:252 start_codon:yes stop_codon:yes gene_type:complete